MGREFLSIIKPDNVIASIDICTQSVIFGQGKTVTILGCGSASGVAIPPFFAFPGKRMNSDLFHGSTPGASATLSETGWSNSEVFCTYLEVHFLKLFLVAVVRRFYGFWMAITHMFHLGL